MTISELLSYLNTTAMVLGYILLVMFLAATLWMAGNWAENWHYKRTRRRRQDVEWDNIRSAWLLDMRARPTTDVYDMSDHIDTLEHPQMVIGSVDRINTDVMAHTISQIVNYQKEHNENDAS